MIKENLRYIYRNEAVVEKTLQELERKIAHYNGKRIKQRKSNWDERDIFLITYGDQFWEENQPKIKTFQSFYKEYLSESFDIVHFLPFFPYSSDDGFSVLDYEMINPNIGNWEDVKDMQSDARLMFDFVCNHMSSKSNWFIEYLKSNPEFENYFIETDPSMDLSSVTRPRTSPLLTKFEDTNGQAKYIWTTFSDDQVDLNFNNPKVLLRMIDVLLYYIENGAEFIRLDAVGFMWKEIGTSCIHLTETHKIIQIFREMVDIVAPGTVLITETNVPHQDNISYFGNGENEAQMVYQFPLPPLVLHAINTEETSYLKKWAAGLDFTNQSTTFFNFLASHDGIGLNPIRGIIPEEQINSMVDEIQKEGGLVNYKNNPDGSVSPYELNVTFMDALNKKDDEDDIRIKRFKLAHSVLLTFPGVPAIYIQSILGSRNDYEGVKNTGENRSINRQKYRLDEIKSEIKNSTSLRSKSFHALQNMIQIRKGQAVFHPNAFMEVVESNDILFAIKRQHNQETLLAIHNFSSFPTEMEVETGKYINLINSEEFYSKKEQKISVQPYEFLWLKKLN